MIKCIALLTLLVLSGACQEPKNNSNTGPGDDTTKVEIIALQYADAAEVADVLNGIYDSSPRIAADQRSNAIVVRGTLDEIGRVRKLIKELDRELKAE